MSNEAPTGFLCPWTPHREKKQRFLIGSLRNKTLPERRLYSLSLVCLEKQADIKLFRPKLHSVNVYLLEQTYINWKVTWDTKNLRHQCRCLCPIKTVIYLQPIGDLPDFVTGFNLNLGHCQIDLLSLLCEFAHIYFLGVDIRVAPPVNVDFEREGIVGRVHPATGRWQNLSTNFFPLLKKMLPDDAFGIMGITWTDLYPAEDLNFTLGETSYMHSAGVFSFGRFEPNQFQNGQKVDDISEVDELLIWKLLKVTVHELCHLYGLKHCEVFHCVMNDSISVEEALSQPIFLCPICLRKLQKACNFQLLPRYHKMLHFFQALCNSRPYYRFSEARDWLQNCTEYLNASTENPTPTIM